MIIEEYKEEFIYLEKLRKSGITNMYGASPYLAEEFGYTKREATDILILWIENYEREDYEGI